MYIAMAGAAARVEQLDSIADNLSNAQTPGFKASRPAFEAFLAASGSQEQAFPAAVATSFDMRDGTPNRTGDPMDITPENSSFIAVRAGNSVAYTRNGHLTVDSNGMLRAGRYLVLQNDGTPITLPPNTVPTINPDGSVRQGDTTFGNIGLFQLAGPIDRQGPELMVPGKGGMAVFSGSRVRVGELETANANVLEATVGMVSAQRNYDSSMQALKTYQSMDDKASDIGRIR
jgi:flagellar basal-body rod protein FlgF